MRHNDELEQLIKMVSKLPGLGPRSSRRIVVELVKKRFETMMPMANLMLNVASKIKTCRVCNNIDVEDPCHICTDSSRDNRTICIVQDVTDLWALERSGVYSGQYFVLGGALSAIDGIGPEKLGIDNLISRVDGNKISEIILATNSTIDGQTTAHYLTECLSSKVEKISKLAQGMPVGGEIDYMDDGTLGTALKLRVVA